MAKVVDANIVAAFLVENELSPAVMRYRDLENGIVPSLCFTETASAVRKYVLADRADKAVLEVVGEFINGFMEEVVRDDAVLEQAAKLSVDMKHSICDCIYLVLAQERSATLITADKRLAALAKILSIDTELVEPK